MSERQVKDQRRSARHRETMAAAFDLLEAGDVAGALQLLGEAVGQRAPKPPVPPLEFAVAFRELCMDRQLIAAYVIAEEAPEGTRLSFGGVTGLAKMIEEALRADLLEEPEPKAGGLWTP